MGHMTVDPGRVEDEDIYCVEKVDVLGWVVVVSTCVRRSIHVCTVP